MRKIKTEHPFFTEIPENWQGRVPTMVVLHETLYGKPEPNKIPVARAGVAMRTVVGPFCEVSVILRDGTIFPIPENSFRVLEWLKVL